MSKTDAINQNDKIVTWMWKIFPKMHSKKNEIFLDSHSRWWIIIDKGSTTCTLLKIAKEIHQGSVDLCCPNIGDRCWRNAGRNLLVTVLAIFVTNIHFYISVGNQHSKDVTNIEVQSPPPTNCHQLKGAKITMSPKSLSLSKFDGDGSLALFRIYFLNFNWYYKYLSSVLSYWRSGPLSEVGMEAPLITWNFPKILYFA